MTAARGAQGGEATGTPHAVTYVEVRVGARLPAVRFVNDLLETALAAVGVDAGVAHDLTLGVAELVANVCEHEYGPGGGEVGVRLDVGADALILTVTSDGGPFDLEGALREAAERDPLEALDEGGLGLPMLVALFDEVRHRHEAGRGNTITLRRAR